MTKQETIDRLGELIEKHPGSYSCKVRAKDNADLFAAICQYVPAKVQGDEYELKTKIYWLIHGLEDFPMCISCGKSMEGRQVKNVLMGYHKCCSPQCAKNSSQRKERYAATCMKKYGVDNASKHAGVKQSKAETTMKHFGVENPAQAKAVQDKMKQTSKERYGVEYVLQSREFLEKAQATMERHYGVKHAMMSLEIQEKAAETTLRHFGVRYPMQNHDIRVKSQARYERDGIRFDSKPELALYIYLSETGADFEYQPDSPFKYEFSGKECVYMPDFRIGGKLVEIKGRQFFKPDGTMQNPYDHSLDAAYEAKRQCMLRNGVEIALDNSKLVSDAVSYV